MKTPKSKTSTESVPSLNFDDFEGVVIRITTDVGGALVGKMVGVQGDHVKIVDGDKTATLTWPRMLVFEGGKLVDPGHIRKIEVVR